MSKGFKIFAINYQKLLSGFFSNTKKVLWFLARDAFLSILLLILLAIVLGEFLFYNYILLAELKEINISTSVVEFKKDTYTSVVEEWEVKENTFNKPLELNYQNPFY